MDRTFIRKPGSRGRQIEIEEKGGIPFFVFPLLKETGTVIHGFTTRLGGVSEGIYASMNLSFTRGDDPRRVMENYQLACGALGFPVEEVICSDQTHTANVRRMGRGDCGKGVLRPRDYTDVDGMITDEPHVALAAFFADCVPLFFVDPVRRAIGLSHSGWKGTAGRIGARTVEAMQEAYGCQPENIRAAVGPSICRDCYEVSRDVVDAFSKSFTEEELRRCCLEKGQGKYQLDLWKANEQILLAAGIRPEHLAVTDVCTCCNPTLLFSHRATNGRRGNLAAFLRLTDEE